MESKTAQNIQDTFLNTVRKDKSQITIYLVSGVKLTGRIRSFDKYSVLLENSNQEQLIFKHAISTVVSGKPVLMGEHRHAPTAAGVSGMAATGTQGTGHAAAAGGYAHGLASAAPGVS
jgi:host factor-I protein